MVFGCLDKVSPTNVLRSIATAGFSDDYKEWHIAKHDVYGERFQISWQNRQDSEIMLEALEEIAPDDDMFDFVLGGIEDIDLVDSAT